jgi:hypothetical protein
LQSGPTTVEPRIIARKLNFPNHSKRERTFESLQDQTAIH